jgi:hypothetical protein
MEELKKYMNSIFIVPNLLLQLLGTIIRGTLSMSLITSKTLLSQGKTSSQLALSRIGPEQQFAQGPVYRKRNYASPEPCLRRIVASHAFTTRSSPASGGERIPDSPEVSSGEVLSCTSLGQPPYSDHITCTFNARCDVTPVKSTFYYSQ